MRGGWREWENAELRWFGAANQGMLLFRKNKNGFFLVLNWFEIKILIMLSQFCLIVQI